MTQAAQPSDEVAVQPERPSAAIRAHVTSVVSRLQGGYLRPSGSTSEAVRTLALLRRSLGLAGGADPRMWALVLEGLPSGLLGPADRSLADPTRAETAVLTAMTTYAVHQQSQSVPMHQPGVGVGDATRSLAVRRARDDAVSGLHQATVERLHRVALAQSEDLRRHALRSLVTLMRSSSPPVGLDYGRLASDLYWLQEPKYGSRVHLAWARQLHNKTAREAVDSTIDDRDNGRSGDTE